MTPRTSAARQMWQIWQDAHDEWESARGLGYDCLQAIRQYPELAFVLAIEAAHHANRALDLLDQLGDRT